MSALKKLFNCRGFGNFFSCFLEFLATFDSQKLPQGF